MSIFSKRLPIIGEKCARCGRQFIPKKEGQIYGPRCARKRAGQIDLSALDNVDRTDAEGEPPVDDRLNLDDIAETRHTVIV